MGVSSYCVKSTATIKENNINAAYKALKAQSGELQLFADGDLQFANNLPGLLEKLSMDFNVNNGNLESISFYGGKGDNSMFVWPALAPYIESGSEIIMDHDGEREITTFENGEYYTDIVDEDYYDDEEIDEAIEQIFEKAEEQELTVNDIKELCQQEAGINSTDYKGNTILHAVIEYYMDEENADNLNDNVEALITAILDAGIDVNHLNNEEESVIYLALERAAYKLAQRIYDHGVNFDDAEITGLLWLASDSHDKLMLDFVTEKNEPSKKAITKAFICACAGHAHREEKQPYIEYFIEKLNPDVNAASDTKLYFMLGDMRKGATPLMAAALSDDPVLIQKLVKLGVEPKAEDDAGNTALHYCSGQTWIGGDCSTAWFAAKGNHECIQHFLELGLSAGQNNKSNKSPYELALEDNRKILPVFNDFLTAKGKPVPQLDFKNLNGVIEFSKDGQLAYRLSFKDGKFDGKQQLFHSSDAICAEITYQDNVPVDSYKVWSKDGTLNFDSQMVNGKFDGEYKVYGPTGELVQDAKYVQGRLNGQALFYDANGDLLAEGNYNKGQKHGRFFMTDKDGKPLLDVEFENDEYKSKEAEQKKEKKKGAGLMDLFTGMFSKEAMLVEKIEEAFSPSKKMFYHKPQKLLEIYKMTQLSLLQE
ncbi:hypothetical protein [Pleionea mediterranea]|uniref:MORN repeat protein n=1 Tax=Pleionea mediterranea TaxID=523701 RepID=A0A316G3K9_9GAMM|nr:hypothetical protein [Pleionea mediterranea]PWK54370.1 MORN repeat protein [Pleionea mediterranea]